MHHGQEIYSFFYTYGTNGILGIILTSILISVIIYKTLEIYKIYKIKTYNEFLEEIVKNKIIKKIIKIIINLFLLFSFYIMIAGISAFLSQQFKCNKFISSIIFSSFCYIIFLKNIDKIIKMNLVIVSIIIIILILFGIKNINYINNQEIVKAKNLWVISSILYASYNSITLIGMIGMMNKYLNTKKDILKVSMTTGIIIFSLAMIIFLLLINIKEKAEIPVLYISNCFGGIYRYLYGIMIFFAIFTTAISDGFTLLKNIEEKSKRKTRMFNLLICGSAIPASQIGFSNLINMLYPLFGIIGLIQIIIILLKK